MLPSTWVNGAKTAVKIAEGKRAKRRNLQCEHPRLQAETACRADIREEIKDVDEDVLRPQMGGEELLAIPITLASKCKL